MTLFNTTPWGSFSTPGAVPSGGSAPYQVNPQPQQGSGAYGAVPGPVTLPNPAGDLAAQLPGLSQANQAASDALLAKLGGRLSPGTLKQMQDYEANFAARSGMPGSNAIPGTLGYNRGVRDIGTTSEAQTEQGLSDYARLVAAVSGTQTVSPNLQAEIAARNAQMAAAPNPFQQQNHAEQLYNEYLNRLRGPAGGTGRGESPGAGTIPTTSTGGGGGFPGQTPYTPYSTNPADIEQDPDGTMWDRNTGEYLGRSQMPAGGGVGPALENPQFPFDPYSGMTGFQGQLEQSFQNQNPTDQWGLTPSDYGDF